MRVRVLQGFTYDVVGERIDGAETGKKAAKRIAVVRTEKILLSKSLREL